MFAKIKQFLKKRDITERDRTLIFSVLLVGSLIGLLASFVLSIEALTLAENKNAILPCSINAVVDCAAVGSHESASAFGFPNAFVGMMALPVMVTIAVAGLAGVKFPRWFMVGATLGALVGFGFAIWMFYMSFVVIQVLCPWCLTLDFGMVLIFFAMLRYAIRSNIFQWSKSIHKRFNGWADQGFDLLLAFVLLIIPVFLIVAKFGDSLFS